MTAGTAKLADLPNELLEHITSYFDEPRQFHRLSQISRRLHHFVEDEGWRIFVRNCFASIQTPPLWKEASHALSTASRNWDRRAVIARPIQPSGPLLKWPRGMMETRWQMHGGERMMGFRPAIDSYEMWTGSSWSSRKQILAFSAGAELVFRIKHFGPTALKRQDAIDEERRLEFDQHRDAVAWITYRPPGTRQGLDDITAVKLLQDSPASPQSHSPVQPAVIGTASGKLQALQVPLQASSDATAVLSTRFRTGASSVGSLDVNGTLLAASISTRLPAGTPWHAGADNIIVRGQAIVLYPFRPPSSPPAHQNEILPISTLEVSPEKGQMFKRIWTTRFLSSSRLAVGTGPSQAPLEVYHIAESELLPVRRFSSPLLIDTVPLATLQGVMPWSTTVVPPTSAYQVMPLPDSNGSREAAGDVFICGFHDGWISVHDMRSPCNDVQTYWDPVDGSSVFSLAAIGRERIVAGGSQHSTLKFFDIRKPDGRACYHTQELDVPAPSPRQTHPFVHGGRRRDTTEGWNLFLHQRDYHGTGRRDRFRRQERLRSGPLAANRASPVYSLSIPSSCSPTIFAGLEGQVVQVDMASMTDKHPDPVFENSIVRRPSTGEIDIRGTWDPKGDVMDLAMYEHEEGGGVDLMTQADSYKLLFPDEWVEGYDERWRRSAKWKK